jgi:hypothetical protein
MNVIITQNCPIESSAIKFDSIEAVNEIHALAYRYCYLDFLLRTLG